MPPEALARQKIDAQLAAAGWIVQDMPQMNLYAGSGVAMREFPLKTGFADYLLFVNHKAVGVIEAKPEGTTLSGVAEQRRIVAEVERRLLVAQEVEAVAAACVQRAGRLRQAVLKAAFEGRLV